MLHIKTPLPQDEFFWEGLPSRAVPYGALPEQKQDDHPGPMPSQFQGNFLGLKMFLPFWSLRFKMKHANQSIQNFFTMKNLMKFCLWNKYGYLGDIFPFSLHAPYSYL